jgi:hypothetical protein
MVVKQVLLKTALALLIIAVAFAPLARLKSLRPRKTPLTECTSG